MQAFALAIVVLAAFVSNAAAQTAAPAPLPPEQASMMGYGDSDKTCAAWTDGCGTCRRGPTGEPICPNIGPACTPVPIRCVRKVGEPDPDAAPPPAPTPAPVPAPAPAPAPQEQKTEPPKQ